MKKKGVISEYLPWILIAVAVLVIIFITMFLMKDQSISLIEKVKNLFR